MSRKGRILKESDLLPLSLGAALLGTGGGGNPYIGMLRCRELLRKGASVEILPLEALGDDDWIGSVRRHRRAGRRHREDQAGRRNVSARCAASRRRWA